MKLECPYCFKENNTAGSGTEKILKIICSHCNESFYYDYSKRCIDEYYLDYMEDEYIKDDDDDYEVEEDDDYEVEEEDDEYEVEEDDDYEVEEDDDEYQYEYDTEEDQGNNFWGAILVVFIAGLFIYNYIYLPNFSNSSSNPYEYSSGKRVGAVCEDGTRSYATGSGACSYHGGVCYWIYDEAPIYRPGPQCPDFP